MLKKILGGGYLAIVISIVMLTLFLVFSAVLNGETAQDYPNSAALFNRTADNVLIFILSIFALGVLQTTITRTLSRIAKPAITAALEDAVEKIQGQTVTDLMRVADEKELSDGIITIGERLYGPHVKSENSLYQSIGGSLSKHFGHLSPYRTNYMKSINIHDRGDGTILWEEICNYSINCPGFNTDAEGLQSEFPLNVLSLSVAEQVKQEDGSIIVPDFSLQVKVDNERILDTGTQMKFSPDGTCEIEQDGLDAQLQSKYLDVKFEHKLLLSKERTDISTIEKSVIRDSTLALHTTVPIYNATVDVTLPINWTVEEYYFDPGWELTEIQDRVMRFQTKGWILPGLYLYFIWGKNSSN